MFCICVNRVVSREVLEGWVSTCSRSLNIDYEVDRRDESDIRGVCSFVLGFDVLESGVVDREVRL